jgi:uncharacterized LabA/DUF88 family protein
MGLLPSDVFDTDDRVAVFIDGANLYQTAKSLGFDIDYRRLLQALSGSCRFLRAYYYTALMDEQEYSPVRPLVDWLEYNGYTLITKPLKEYSSGPRRKYKGNMDVDIAVDMLEIAPHVNHVILGSGDGDFRRLVEAVQRKGVRVSVLSTLRTQPPMIADELRRQADVFLDLYDLAPHIARESRPQQAYVAPPDDDEEEDLEDDEDLEDSDDR